MSFLRWSSVALLTLVATSALPAQTAQEAEELPACRRCEINLLSAFVSECLACWQEQWRLGNYSQAQMLADVACRLDATNQIAQHALVLSEIMHGLCPCKDNCNAAPDTQRAAADAKDIVPTLFGVELQVGLPAITRFVVGSEACAAGSDLKKGCKEGGCSAAAGASKPCQGASTKDASTCSACAKTNLGTSKSAGHRSGCLTVEDLVEAIKKYQIKTLMNLQNDCCCRQVAKALIKPCGCASPPSSSCAAKAVAAKEVPQCCCNKDCGCGKSIGPENNTRSRMLTPSSFTVIKEVSSGGAYCPFLEELGFVVPIPMPAPRSVPGSLIAVPPLSPMCVSSPLAHPLFHGRALLPTGFGPGMPLRMPTPADGLDQLECDHVELVGSSATNKVHPASPAVDRPVAPVTKDKVHLVTQHLEAYCQRVVSTGGSDHVLLEGDVHLLCNRHGQTLRIQGERVTVHLSDGTFAVESTSDLRHLASPPRVRAPAPQASYSPYQPATYIAPPMPWEVVRPVRAINDTPPYEPYKPEN